MTKKKPDDGKPVKRRYQSSIITKPFNALRAIQEMILGYFLPTAVMNCQKRHKWLGRNTFVGVKGCGLWRCPACARRRMKAESILLWKKAEVHREKAYFVTIELANFKPSSDHSEDDYKRFWRRFCSGVSKAKRVLTINLPDLKYVGVYEEKPYNFEPHFHCLIFSDSVTDQTIEKLAAVCEKHGLRLEYFEPCRSVKNSLYYFGKFEKGQTPLHAPSSLRRLTFNDAYGKLDFNDLSDLANTAQHNKLKELFFNDKYKKGTFTEKTRFLKRLAAGLWYAGLSMATSHIADIVFKAMPT